MKDTIATARIRQRHKSDGTTTRGHATNSITKVAMAIAIVSAAKSPVWTGAMAEFHHNNNKIIPTVKHLIFYKIKFRN